MKVLVATALAVMAAGPAAAQSRYGDTQLSYQNGIVYDDDLVPGGGPNSSFLIEEQSPQFSTVRSYSRSFGTTANIPANSPDLIGRDGRRTPDVYSGRR